MKKSELCNLIPHSGNMCLLDDIIEWDDTHVICITTSHTDDNNPLRNEHGLPMMALIEYAAQAMAIHGGLRAKLASEKMQSGYLAALRDVTLADGYASDNCDSLLIEANQLMASAGNMIYQFTVKQGEECLASGRATVVALFRDPAD